MCNTLRTKWERVSAFGDLMKTLFASVGGKWDVDVETGDAVCGRLGVWVRAERRSSLPKPSPVARKQTWSWRCSGGDSWSFRFLPVPQIPRPRVLPLAARWLGPLRPWFAGRSGRTVGRRHHFYQRRAVSTGVWSGAQGMPHGPSETGSGGPRDKDWVPEAAAAAVHHSTARPAEAFGAGLPGEPGLPLACLGWLWAGVGSPLSRTSAAMPCPARASTAQHKTGTSPPSQCMVPEAVAKVKLRFPASRPPLLNFGGMELFPFGHHASAAAQLPAPKVPFFRIAKGI